MGDGRIPGEVYKKTWKVNSRDKSLEEWGINSYNYKLQNSLTNPDHYKRARSVLPVINLIADGLVIQIELRK